MSSKKPVATTSISVLGVKATLREMLERIEKAEAEKAAVRGLHSELFKHLDSLDSVIEETKESMKRLIFTKGGPPDDDDVTGRMWVPAEGTIFDVRIVYAKEKDSYDPAKLPKAVLSAPGVVTEVDTDVVNALLAGMTPAKRYRVRKALQEGKWKTPALEIRRRED